MRTSLPYRTPRDQFDYAPSLFDTSPAARHERIEQHHVALAHLVHETLTSADTAATTDRAMEPPEHLAQVLELLLGELNGARRELEALLRAMPADQRRAQLRAIALLTRAHDEAWRELYEAQLALEARSLVSVRIRMAHLFAVMGRAEQMHYYLRTARQPAD